MAAPVHGRAPCWLLAFAFLTCIALVSTVSALEFRVGGERGWRKPTGNETETYNGWARRNRFHIGDSVYFKYENDSVLVVDYDDYSQCNLTSPQLKFVGGNTTFKFYRYGFFYFISGEAAHCNAGQKLIIRVMVHPMSMGPQPAPAPSGDTESGWGSGPSALPKPSSSFKLRIELSVVMAALVVALATSLLV